METLPYEMVLKIGQQLTPQDLAHCCGVSRGWRDAFNQDRLWKPHCDPVLEEHLRTTPSIVEPVFVVPGGEDSTLEPLCQWRLAFLREQHLRSNWKHNYHRTESLFELKNEVYREFLTNKLVVRWFKKSIEVWNVSVDPAVFVAKTDPSVDIDGWINCFVGTSLLLVVEQIGSVKVFFVDIINKSIQLKHEISLDDVKSEPADSDYVRHLKRCSTRYERPKKRGLDCVKANVFVHVNTSRAKLDIFSLETGIKIKEQPFSKVRNRSEKFEVVRISASPTSDYVLVVAKMIAESNPVFKNYRLYALYNPQKLSFVEGSFVYTKSLPQVPNFGDVHRHYLAVADRETCTVYDCHPPKADVLLRSDLQSKIGFYSPGSNDNFLYKDLGPTISIKMFDLQSRTVTTVEGLSVASGSTSRWPGLDRHKYKVFNNKLFALSDPEFGWYLLLENVWVKCDVPFEDNSIINQTFTKVISQDSSLCPPRDFGRQEEWYIYHYW